MSASDQNRIPDCAGCHVRQRIVALESVIQTKYGSRSTNVSHSTFVEPSGFIGARTTPCFR